MALFRIASGFTTLVATATFVPDVEALLSRDGVAPIENSTWRNLGLYGDAPSLTHSWIVLGITLAAAVLVIVGWHTRIVVVIAAVGFISLGRRDIWALNGGDILVQVMAVYLCLMPSGRVWSLDARRDRKKKRVRGPVAVWPVRVVQIQICVVYLATVIAKVPGSLWLDGSAVSYALRMQDVARLPVVDFVVHNGYIINALTWGTIAIELSVPLLVWFTVTRKPVLIAGAMLHIGIHSAIMVGPFSMAMLTGYVAFLTSAQATWWLRLPERWCDRLRRRMNGADGEPELVATSVA